ncbi:hypothetical protein ACHAQA_007238 [Verticillium albo-atrum]
MTNVMAATYPDLFQAGIAYAGVPAGCFSLGTTEAGWNSTCANGQSITTAEHWASIARNMAPGYTGRRPRMQIYHGDQDAVVFPQNYYETIKQWADPCDLNGRSYNHCEADYHGCAAEPYYHHHRYHNECSPHYHCWNWTTTGSL